MKKALSICVLALACTAAMAQRTTITVDGVVYEVKNGDMNSGELSVTYLTDGSSSNIMTTYSGDVVVPATLTYGDETTTEQYEFTVTGVTDYAFYGSFGGLTSVTLPNTVTTIGMQAFRDCSGITAITLPESVTEIGSTAFYGCTSLASVNLPSGLTAIPDLCFTSTALTSIDIPEGVTEIGYAAFNGCTLLTQATLPSTLTTMGYFCFAGTAIEEVNIPGSVKNWDNGYVETDGSVLTGYQYYGCPNIKSVTIGEGVTSIPNVFFYGNGGENEDGSINYTYPVLAKVVLPSTLKTLPAYSFAYSQALSDVTLPEGLQAIGDAAFYDCPLVNVALPSTLGSIGSMAFYNTGMTDVVIPASVDEVGSYAFSMCPLTSVKLTEGVGKVCEAAFYPCTNVTTLDLGTVTEVEAYAFYDLPNITELTLPSTLTAIGGSAFYNSPRVQSLTLPEGLTSVGSMAFNNLSITELNVPASVTELGQYCFGGTYHLESVTYNWSDLSAVTVGGEVFSTAAYNATAYVPSGTESAYAANSSLVTSNFGGGVVAIGTADSRLITTESGVRYYIYMEGSNYIPVVFSQPTSIEGDVVIANSFLYLGVLPMTVQQLTPGAFYCCEGLTGVTIPSNITAIYSQTFGMCTGLTTVILESETAPTADSDAFGDLDLSQISLVVPDAAVSAYKANAFWGQFDVQAASGIATAQAATTTAQGIYDLSGRRLSAAAKGINIINGKKVVK